MALIAGPGNPASRSPTIWCGRRRTRRTDTYATPAPGSVPHFIGVMLAKASVSNSLRCTIEGRRRLGRTCSAVTSPPISARSATTPSRGIKREARVLAITGTARSKALPDVPTFAEAGFKDLAIDEWFGCSHPPEPGPRRLRRSRKRSASRCRAASSSSSSPTTSRNRRSARRRSSPPASLGAGRLGTDRAGVGFHRGRVTARAISPLGAAG